ncbi:MAG TPA: hypothetical protein VMW23_08850 [Sedimentisphaerales bacterium]|nr:hypothetical protein [Sedimentisphaerales bacterium]
MNRPDIIVALETAVGCFEKLGIAYCIGGSVASSAYGIARATMDVDLIADIKMSQLNPLVQALQTHYYIDAEMVADAIRRSASFNLIHLQTMIKLDVFILRQHPYHSEAFSRRKPDSLDAENSRTFYIFSPEDIILSKLQWYQQGGAVSQQQWKDVVGVLKVQGDKLNFEYLKHWASRLNLSDLLNRSFDDAGMTENA